MSSLSHTQVRRPSLTRCTPWHAADPHFGLPHFIQILKQASKLIPPLTADKHKGDAGRIGIVGGSAE